MPFFTFNELAEQFEYTVPTHGRAVVKYTYPVPASYEDAYKILRSMLLHNPEVSRSELEHAVTYIESFLPKK